MPSFEVLLPVVAIGLYLFDSVLMLYGDELALERRRSGWRSSGGRTLQIAGRLAFLPNPFAPWRLLFRLRWSETAAVDGVGLDIAGLRRLARPLQVIALLQVMLLVCALPPLSTMIGAGATLLTLFAAFYGLSCAGIAVLIARRRALRVSNRQCVVLAIETLACAPFAPNLVRKITLARSPELDWLALAESSFSSKDRHELWSWIAARTNEQLAVEEPDSGRAIELQTLQEHLRERLHVDVAK